MNLISRPTTQSSANRKRALLEEQLRQAISEPDTIPLSFAQQRLWLLDQLEPNSSLYNIPVAVELLGKLDTAALQNALDRLVERHEILRTCFSCINENPVQVVEENMRL